jgi:hypothetical protein
MMDDDVDDDDDDDCEPFGGMLDRGNRNTR